MTDPLGIKTLLNAIGWMIEKEKVVAHRFIDSGEGLSYYTKFPEGLIWHDSKLAGINLFYTGTTLNVIIGITGHIEWKL
jgi:hypothetical protein